VRKARTPRDQRVARLTSIVAHSTSQRARRTSRKGPFMNNGSMTKAELVEEVSRVSDLTKKHSEVIVDTVFKSIIDALHRGEKIELRGFGSFRLRRREPRKGRNPKTGDKVDVPPKQVPYFKPGKELKDLINREPEPAPAEAPAPSVPPVPSGTDLAGV
jgi:integration host factor subunit beta